MYYIPSIHKYISTVILYIHSGHIMATCFDRETVIFRPTGNIFKAQKIEHSMGSHWVVNLLYLKNVLYWPEDDRLRSKRVAKMWPECIYNITVLICSCVLAEYNTLYKFSGWFLLRCNWNSNKRASVSLCCIRAKDHFESTTYLL